MTYILELAVTMKDGSQNFDFCHVYGTDSKEEAIEAQKNSLLTIINKAKAGNKIWASNSANYAEWDHFTLV